MIRSALACAVVLPIAVATSAGARDVTVSSPDGRFDPSVRVACIDPAASSAQPDSRGRATVPDDCRAVRCESARWLSSEVRLGPAPVICALRPAVKLAVEFPEGAGDRIEVTLGKAGAKSPMWKSIAKVRLEAPPLAPGRYQLRAGRPDGSWTCAATMRFDKPEPTTVFVPSREPRWVHGRAVARDGTAIPRIHIAAFQAESGRWRCEGHVTEETRSADDGTFRLPTDPAVETLIVAGGWRDPMGIAYAVVPATGGEALELRPVLPHRVAAHVVDDEGRPAGCRAVLSIDDRGERWAARVVSGGAKESTCRPDGTLEVGPFLANAYEIDLRSDDALPLRVPGTVPEGAMFHDLGELRVERGATLRVTVRDEDDRAIGGATILVASRGGWVLQRRTTTGSDGVAIVRGIPRKVAVTVKAEAAGYVRSTRDGVAPEGELALVLIAADAIRGHVIGVDGSGVRASVRAASRNGAPLDETETDEAGSFSMTSMPDELVLLRADAPGFRPSEIVRVPPGASGRSKDVTLVVLEAGKVRGSVHDANGGALAGATVVLVREVLRDPPEAGAEDATRSAHDGHFELASSGLPGEIVVATASGHAAAVAQPAPELALTLQPEAHLLVRIPRMNAGSSLHVLDAAGVPRVKDASGPTELHLDGLAPGPCAVALGTGRQERVQLRGGETAVVDFTAGARLHGQVREGGRPCPRAAVMLAGAREGGITRGSTVLTDVQGQYTIDGAAPGAYVLVATTGGGRAEQRVDVPDSGELRVDLDIVERALHVVVREHGTGRGVPDAVVTATPAGSACAAFATGSFMENDMGWDVSISSGGCARGQTGADGSALLVVGRAGRHDVSVGARGFETWMRSVDLVDGTSELVVELTRGGPPVVRVQIDSDPPLVAGTFFCVQPGKNFSRSPVAGETECEGLAPGPAEVAFRADDIAIGRAAVEVPVSGEVTVPLRAPRAGRLVVPLEEVDAQVRILDARGSPWNLPYGLGWPRCGPENQAGAPVYVCRELPPGTYTVEVGGRRRPQVLVRGGETAIAY